MPRFFFHVHTEGPTLGAIEEDLPDESIALPMARGVARELLADIEGEWGLARIEVTDEQGILVGVISLHELGFSSRQTTFCLPGVLRI
jgi:hypothetical protein